MLLLAIVAGIVAVMHLAAGWERPRLAIVVSGILWALYAYYEYLVATGVLCEANCNIRVDLVFFLPILGLATFWAYQAYKGRTGKNNVVGSVLGIVGLLVGALVLEAFGYRAFSVAALVGALAIGVYAIRSRFVANRT